MRILISNDDGYRAPGLVCLANALRSHAEISVFAPDRDRSGASNSLTLENPIRISELDNGFIRVNGTPTDCVHLAITGLLDEEPDMVVSGINAGANLGDDVIYSGTVAAAMEGRFLGFPALAVSLAGSEYLYFQTAARVVVNMLGHLQRHPLPADIILNVNVPDVPWEQLAGFQVTRLGHRHKAEPVIKMTDPRGEPVYWVGPSGPEQDAGEGTDFHAIKHNFVSITPLQVDLTRHSALAIMGEWVESMEIS